VVTGGTSGRLFGCILGDRIGIPVTVEMRVWDMRFFNSGTTTGSDFCKTRLTLIDNQGGCGEGTLVTLGGNIETESSVNMNGVQVSLMTDLPDYPVVTKTNEEGNYVFRSLPVGVDYTIKPAKSGDYMNGVNTLDLVQIQRHILGIDKLESPYKMIAADADDDGSIRINDILVLRRLILGVTDTISNVASWRFVDKSAKMEATPWPFNEVISHGALSEDRMSDDFIGVKIGDVNGTVSANTTSAVLSPRGKGITLLAEDKVLKTGDVVEVKLNAGQFRDVYGMQFTMRHEGLNLMDIDGRGIEVTHENTGRIGSGLTTFSWVSGESKSVSEGSDVMIISFKVTKDAMLSEVLKITSDVTVAEGYVGSAMERKGISLEFVRKQGMPFDVYQNEPNPWMSDTKIRFDLPVAGDVRLTIMDVTGKIIKSFMTEGAAGNNEIIISREQLGGASGVLLYQITSDNNILQKKMLVVE
jgi:hypothetical protein